MDAEGLWNCINEKIKSQKTTQRALALQCGFTERRIESLSSSNRLPDAIEITKIAQALGTSVEYLVTGEDKSPVMEENAILKDRINRAIETLTNKSNIQGA